MNNVFNFSRRKVGGIWFVKLGRFNISFCISRGTFVPSPLHRDDVRLVPYVGGNEITMVAERCR